MKFETARLHFISKVFASRRGCSACPSSSSCKCRAWTQATLESINDTLLVFQSMALCHAHWVISQFLQTQKNGMVSVSCFLTAYIRDSGSTKRKISLASLASGNSYHIVEVPKNPSVNNSFNQRFAIIKMDHR